MAYPVPLSSILELVANMTVNGQQCMSVFHYKYNTGSSIPDGRAAAVDFLNKIRVAGALKDAYVGCISDQIVDITWRAQWITPNRFRHVFLAVAPDAGTAAANPLPVQVSAAITKQAQNATRHGSGTLHMPGVPTSFVVDSLITLVGHTAYLALCDKVILPITLTGGQILDPVLFNRVTPNNSETIIQAFAQNTSRVNRRRTVGVGS
jgi:hypothetical protein